MAKTTSVTLTIVFPACSTFLSVNRCPGNIYCINENNLLIVSKWPFKGVHKTFKYAASKIIFLYLIMGRKGQSIRDKSSLREKSDYMGSVHFIQPKCH